MSIICITPTDSTHASTQRRRSLRLRRRTGVREAFRHRQPLETVSEQVLAGIHGVHSLQR